MMVYEKYVGYENPIVKKSFDFAVRILKFFIYYNKKDFINKLTIALKEARETEYWLNLLITGEVITENEFSSLNPDCKEIIKILVSIIKTSKNNL